MDLLFSVLKLFITLELFSKKDFGERKYKVIIWYTGQKLILLLKQNIDT